MDQMQFGEIGAPAPDGSPGGAPGPLFIHSPHAGDNFQCRENNSTWRIDLSCEKSSLYLDLSECCSNIFLTFDAWEEEGLGEVPAEIKFADKFSQVFSASRVLG